MSESALVARYLGGTEEQILVVGRRPPQATGPCVLIVPPFAEEMNKSRRMCTAVAQALCAHSIGSVIPDLFGTGDSAGEFRDADWQRWLEDLRRTAAWSAAEGWPITGLLGIRLGSILAAEFAATVPGIGRTVFWQPVLDGARYLAQFLRLRVASSMMKEGAAETATELRSRLRQGEVLEVAGYELAPRLVEQIEAARFVESAGACLGAVHWIEIVRSVDTALPMPSQKAIEGLQSKGLAVTSRLVAGEPFWTSTEIVLLPEMVAQTVAAFREAA